MKLKNPQLIFLSSCAITSASTAEAVDTDGPAGTGKDCTFGSNYRYIQNYTAGEACPFDVSIGEQRINVTLVSNKTGADDSIIEIYNYHYNNAVWKTGEKESSTYCMYDQEWIMNKTINGDGSMLVTTVGGEWLQLGMESSPVDNLNRPGLYQLKPGEQQAYYNTTEVNLGIGGSFVYVRGNIIDLCAAVEDASSSDATTPSSSPTSAGSRDGGHQVVALVLLPAVVALFSFLLLL